MMEHLFLSQKKVNLMAKQPKNGSQLYIPKYIGQKSCVLDSKGLQSSLRAKDMVMIYSNNQSTVFVISIQLEQLRPHCKFYLKIG